MSHRFTRPKPYTKQGREDAEMRRLAALVHDQESLDELLGKCAPELRFAVYDRLRLYLGFENPVCGEPQPPEP